MASTWVDQAAGQLATKGVVQTGLVTTDAGVDLIAATLGRFVDEVWVSEEWTRHGDHVSVTLSQHLLGHFRGVDAVGGDQRNTDLAAQLGGDLGERGARHLGGDGRNTRFVPADAGIDQGRAGFFDGFGQQDDLVPGAAAFNQIQHRQAIDDDEVRADGLTYATDDLHRQTHAVLVATAPTVGTVVGVGGEELVNEITFRPHDLHTVVLGLLGQHGAGDEILDLLLDAFLVQLFRLERIDRRLNGARRYRFRAVGVATGVENLHADLAVRSVHGAGHDLVLFGFFRGGQLGCAGIHTTLIVRANTTGDHQANATTGTLGEIRRHALKTIRFFFQPGVHRAHQGAVLQRGEAQIKRGQQIGVQSSHGYLHIGCWLSRMPKPLSGSRSNMV